MKKLIIMLGIIGMISAQTMFAEEITPRIQANAGYSLPMPNLSNAVNGALYFGGSIGIDTSFLSPISALELSFSTATFTGKTDTAKKLIISPILLSGIFNIDIASPEIKPYAKIGGGLVFESSNFTGAELTQSDPGFLGGIGAVYNLAPKFDIKFEISYLFIYQTWVTDAAENASMINIGLGLNYKF